MSAGGPYFHYLSLCYYSLLFHSNDLTWLCMSKAVFNAVIYRETLLTGQSESSLGIQVLRGSI